MVGNIDTQTGAPAGLRAKLSLAPTDQDKAQVLKDWLREHGVQDPLVAKIQNRSHPYYGEWVYKGKDGRWYLVDEEGLTWRDLADLAGAAAPVGLEMVGSVAGFSAGGPPGGVAGAAGGRALGEAVNMGLRKALGVPDSRSGEERYSEVARQAGFAAAGDVAGQAAMGVVSKVLAPGAKAMTPEAREFLAESRRLGLKPTPTDIKRTRSQALVESYLAKIPGASNVYQRRLAENAEGLGKALGEFHPEAYQERSLVAAGDRAALAFQDTVQAFRKQGEALFGQVRALAQGKPLDGALRRFQAKLEETLLKPAVEEGALFDKPFLERLYQVVTREGIEFEDAWDLRQALQARIETAAKTPVSKREVGLYKTLVHRLDDDLREWARKAGPEIWEQYKLASKIYKPSVAMLNSDVGKMILKWGKEGPEQIARRLFVAGNTTKIRQARKLLGDEAFQGLAKAWLAEHFFKNVRVQIVGPGHAVIDTFSAARLTSAMNRIGRETLEAIIGKVGYRRLEQLATLASKYHAVQQLAGNPSGTGQIIMMDRLASDLYQALKAAQAGGTLAGGIIGGVKGAALTGATLVGVPWALAKFILSRRGTKWLTEGAFSPGTRRVVGEATRAGVRAAGETAGKALFGRRQDGR